MDGWEVCGAPLSVHATPVIHGSSACSTVAPVLPMITPTRYCCSSVLKCSEKRGHSSASSARMWVSREARMAAHIGRTPTATAWRAVSVGQAFRNWMTCGGG